MTNNKENITIIGKFFDVEYGQHEYESKSFLDGNDGLTPLISSKGTENGVYGFFDITPYYKAPFITVPRVGTIGQAFVQLRDCCVDNNCMVLIPKRELSIEILLQVAYQIRAIKWKYKYGRQITPARLKIEKIKLIESKFNYKKFERKILPKRITKSEITKPSINKICKVSDFFNVTKGGGSYLEKMEEGSTPVISTQNADCGVVGFYDIDPIFDNKTITVGRIKCNPNVQLKKYCTVPDDIFVLIPKKKFSLEILFYFASLIKQQSWRFNYSRKLTKKKLETLEIPAPYKNHTEYDFDYIEKVASESYGFTELQQYFRKSRSRT